MACDTGVARARWTEEDSERGAEPLQCHEPLPNVQDRRENVLSPFLAPGQVASEGRTLRIKLREWRTAIKKGGAGGCGGAAFSCWHYSCCPGKPSHCGLSPSTFLFLPLPTTSPLSPSCNVLFLFLIKTLLQGCQSDGLVCCGH